MCAVTLKILKMFCFLKACNSYERTDLENFELLFYKMYSAFGSEATGAFTMGLGGALAKVLPSRGPYCIFPQVCYQTYATTLQSTPVSKEILFKERSLKDTFPFCLAQPHEVNRG